MSEHTKSVVKVDAHVLSSKHLGREVKVDCYLPINFNNYSDLSLLLINDGQDLQTMCFNNILDELYVGQKIKPLFCVGIHCATDRKNEYGTAGLIDYKGRGAKADLYHRFVFEELLPFVRKEYAVVSFAEKAFAGFSLGGLSAMDIVWANPQEFTLAAVFSGSFWWRDKDQDDEDFDENANRIMHRLVREGSYSPWQKFFFEVGTMDETADRNNNGIIDSIDDTLDLIKELNRKGYNEQKNICYLELQDGKHDVETWARSFPVFLTWAWGLNKI